MPEQEKKPEAKKPTVVFNGSGMSYKLKPGPDGEPRRLEVGKAIETLDEKEAAFLLDYHGVVDVSKVMPKTSTDQQLKELQDKVKSLESENGLLKEQLQGSLAGGGKAPKDKK